MYYLPSAEITNKSDYLPSSLKTKTNSLQKTYLDPYKTLSAQPASHYGTSDLHTQMRPVEATSFYITESIDIIFTQSPLANSGLVHRSRHDRNKIPDSCHSTK
jgi:hypothetical protein